MRNFCSYCSPLLLSCCVYFTFFFQSSVFAFHKTQICQFICLIFSVTVFISWHHIRSVSTSFFSEVSLLFSSLFQTVSSFFQLSPFPPHLLICLPVISTHRSFILHLRHKVHFMENDPSNTSILFYTPLFFLFGCDVFFSSGLKLSKADTRCTINEHTGRKWTHCTTESFTMHRVEHWRFLKRFFWNSHTKKLKSERFSSIMNIKHNHDLSDTTAKAYSKAALWKNDLWMNCCVFLKSWSWHWGQSLYICLFQLFASCCCKLTPCFLLYESLLLVGNISDMLESHRTIQGEEKNVWNTS